jgi:hypothetical protein
MRRLLPLVFLCVLPLSAQSVQVSVIRQPQATNAEFTVPITSIQLRNGGDFGQVHLGVGAGFRHWDDGDNALRILADANAAANQLFLGVGAIVEIRSGERAFIGPRLRVGWAFHPNWAVSLEGEHLEQPFADGLHPTRRSSLGLALTARF